MESRLAAMVLLAAFAVSGCDDSPLVAPVTGVVTLDGEPLKFGYVVFQPTSGQMSKSEIGSDGSFEMSTFKLHDGATIGTHLVSVKCNEGHSPEARAQRQGDGVVLGRSLVPAAYTRGNMSGITADVPKEGLPDFRIELSSQGPGR
ncbi:MAG: hypothetical protein AAFV43_11240 [Planctomycetota bacterium]